MKVFDWMSHLWLVLTCSFLVLVLALIYFRCMTLFRFFVYREQKSSFAN